MKKTRVKNNFVDDTLPSVLWESSGVRYPFLSGYTLVRIRGELKQIDANILNEDQDFLRFMRIGWRLKWKNPTCDLLPSLYRLSRYCLANAYVRIWIKQRGKNLYRGYLVQVIWPCDWQEQYWLSKKEFSLSFWS